MIRTKRKRVYAILPGIFFSFAVALILTSCGTARSAGQSLRILQAMMCAEDNCPAGDVYLLPGSPSCAEVSGDAAREARDTLTAALFSGEEIPWQLSGVDDGAIRLSVAASPCEFMVFHCVSRSDADDVVTLLSSRLYALQKTWAGTDGAAMTEQGGVTVLGNYVILTVSSDPERAIDAARRAIH